MPALTMILHLKKCSHHNITSQNYQISKGQRLLFPTVTVSGIYSWFIHR